MHLERDIKEGKFGHNKKLLHEANEELEETKKGKALKKAIENKKKGRPYKHIKGHEGKNLI